MSLTREDLQQIEAIFDRKLDPITDELKALREDIKETYNMITVLQASGITDSNFNKKILEETASA